MSLSTSSVALQLLLQAKDETGAAMGAVERKLGKLGGVSKAAIGALTGGTATAALGFLSDAARLAAADEANMLKLKTAVENTGASWDDNSDAISERIKKGQDLAFSDDQIRDSLSTLVAQTGDLGKALDLQTTAMDLARGKGIDLGNASEIVGKVAEGNVGILKRYGVTLKDGATATEALGVLHQKFGGQAKTYGESTSGSIDKVKDSLSEWKESIGAALGPATGIIALLPGLSSGMTLAGTAIGGLSSLIKLTAIPSLIAMAVPFLPIILVIGAIGLAVGLLALAWSNNWFDIQGKTKAALEFIGGVFDGFKVFLANFGLAIIHIIKGAIGTVIGILNTLIDGWNAVAEHLGLPILGHIKVDTPGLDAAEAALNEAARPRNANIYVNVQDAPQWWGPGGGSHPQAAGGDYMVTRPTLFLAGEAGPERATFTPLGRGGAQANESGGGVTINVATLIVREDADVGRIARELEQLSRSSSRRIGTTLQPSR